MVVTESSTLETVAGLIADLPEHRRVDAAKIALEALSAEAYEALLLELDWVDLVTIESLREDVAYWQYSAKQAEGKLAKIAAICDEGQ